MSKCTYFSVPAQEACAKMATDSSISMFNKPILGLNIAYVASCSACEKQVCVSLPNSSCAPSDRQIHMAMTVIKHRSLGLPWLCKAEAKH
eukprot:2356508-Amphidinium_carterae.1